MIKAPEMDLINKKIRLGGAPNRSSGNYFTYSSNMPAW
jgi:hypothetical protein